jgi:hypothetical protein
VVLICQGFKARFLLGGVDNEEILMSQAFPIIFFN